MCCASWSESLHLQSLIAWKLVYAQAAAKGGDFARLIFRRDAVHFGRLQGIFKITRTDGVHEGYFNIYDTFHQMKCCQDFVKSIFKIK